MIPHIVFSYAGPSRVNIEYSSWDGMKWNFYTVDDATSGYGSIALDNINTPHIAYCVDPGVKYATLDDTNWKIETVDPRGNSPCIALDDEQRPHISYVAAANNSSIYDELRYASWNGATWDIDYSIDMEHTWGISITSLALDREGYAHIVYDKGAALMYATNKPAVHEITLFIIPSIVTIALFLVANPTKKSKNFRDGSKGGL